MPKTEAARRAACARAYSDAKVMESMSKEKAAGWCHSKPETGVDRMRREPTKAGKK